MTKKQQEEAIRIIIDNRIIKCCVQAIKSSVACKVICDFMLTGWRGAIISPHTPLWPRDVNLMTALKCA